MELRVELELDNYRQRVMSPEPAAETSAAEIEENKDTEEVLRSRSPEDMFAEFEDDYLEDNAFIAQAQSPLGPLHSSSFIEEDVDTDTASEDDTTLAEKYGMRPFLLQKFKNKDLNITGD